MMSNQRTAMVTGSSNGIGEAIVKKLAQLDYKLIVTGRSQVDVARVANECTKLSPSGGRPLEILADLMVEQEVDSLFKKAIDFFGGRLDLLVNNAGFNWPVEHTKPDECYQAYKAVMQVNVSSAVRLTLLAAQQMRTTVKDYRQGRAASMVFVGSISGSRPTEGLAAYSTSKAAISMFARSIAGEFGPEIRVNCVEPGPIGTKIVERAGSSMELFEAACGRKTILKRIGTADEVAEAVLFLADDQKSAFITGSQLVIDGGVLAQPIYWSK